MEEFRAVMCDRFVLSLINRRQLNANDFTVKENGTVLMGRRHAKDVPHGMAEAEAGDDRAPVPR